MDFFPRKVQKCFLYACKCRGRLPYRLALRKDGFAGTCVTRSLRKDGFAGTGQAAFPTERWLCRNGTSHIPYNNIAPQELDKHFVKVIDKGLTVPIDQILRK